MTDEARPAICASDILRIEPQRNCVQGIFPRRGGFVISIAKDGSAGPSISRAA